MYYLAVRTVYSWSICQMLGQLVSTPRGYLPTWQVVVKALWRTFVAPWRSATKCVVEDRVISVWRLWTRSLKSWQPPRCKGCEPRRGEVRRLKKRWPVPRRWYAPVQKIRTPGPCRCMTATYHKYIAIHTIQRLPDDQDEAKAPACGRYLGFVDVPAKLTRNFDISD